LQPAAGDYSVQVNSLQLLVDGVVSLTLYLYSELKAEPLWSKEVTTEANSQVLATDLLSAEDKDLELSYLNGDVKGGTYYLGYYQEELGSVHALDYTPNRHSYHCVNAQAFEATVNGDATDFDRRQISLTSKTYGLNLDMTVYRDYTEVIVRQPHL